MHANAVVLADLGTAQAAEIAFCLIGAGVVIAESEAMIDALGLIMGVQDIPAGGLIGIDGCALGDHIVDHVGGIGLMVDHERQRTALACV